MSMSRKSKHPGGLQGAATIDDGGRPLNVLLRTLTHEYTIFFPGSASTTTAHLLHLDPQCQPALACPECSLPHLVCGGHRDA
jgi:hypothetical protein